MNLEFLSNLPVVEVVTILFATFLAASRHAAQADKRARRIEEKVDGLARGHRKLRRAFYKHTQKDRQCSEPGSPS